MTEDEDAKTIAATPAAILPPAAAAETSAAPDATTTSVPTAPGSGPLPTIGLSMAASVVMHSEQAARARAFFALTAGMTLVAAAFMPFVPGPPLLRALAMSLCALAAVIGLVVVRTLRNESRYTPALATMLGVVFGITGELALFYFGLFTAAAMVLPLGVYFFGLSESPRAASTTYVVGAVFYALLSVGVVTGVLPDLGPMPISHLPAGWRWFFVVMTQVVFATTFFLARSSRRATQTAIARVERATRQIQQRDALLVEARGELDRAQRPGEGRYSGQILAGYTLGEVVGRGGMGEVYRAENAETGELAAVKLLHPTILSDPEQVKRFVREAEIAEKVDSPFVARVLRAGLSPSGLPYVAMELLQGHDLAWHLRKATRLPLGRVTELVDHTAQALVAIREAGIVHRDLKPHNLVLHEADARVWKVLDFGVSRYESAAATMTHGALVGTPSYMAPEQVRLEAVDHRTDLYALANVVYRTLTGKPAFVGDDLAGVLYNVVHTPPPQPSSIVRLPPDVELVLAIAMAKAPADRFQSAEELAAAFRDAAKGNLGMTTRERGLKMVSKYPWSTPEIRAAG
jgi:eukaryotic-like serine/threonine-protein kinase